MIFYFDLDVVAIQVLYTTVCASKEPSEPSDFVPLSVQYQERFSAAGRTRLAEDVLKYL